MKEKSVFVMYKEHQTKLWMFQLVPLQYFFHELKLQGFLNHRKALLSFEFIADFGLRKQQDTRQAKIQKALTGVI